MFLYLRSKKRKEKIIDTDLLYINFNFMWTEPTIYRKIIIKTWFFKNTSNRSRIY